MGKFGRLAMGAVLLRGSRRHGAAGFGEGSGAGRGRPSVPNPATIGGHPNLNGIWQAIDGADNGLEPHSAQTSPGPKSERELGAIAAIPAEPRLRRRRHDSLQARRQEGPRRQHEGRPGQGSRGELLPARHPARDLRQRLAVPDHPGRRRHPDGLRIRIRPTASSRSARSAFRRSIPGWARPTASGKATPWSSRRSPRTAKSWLDRTGNYLTNSATVTERFTLKDHDHMDYEGDDRRSDRLCQAVDDPHDALPARRAECSDPRVQVRAVRRDAPLRRPLRHDGREGRASASASTSNKRDATRIEITEGVLRQCVSKPGTWPLSAPCWR